MTHQQYRLGNFLKKIDGKEHLRITGLHEKFVQLNDSALLDWHEVEPIAVTENDLKYIFQEYGYAVTDCNYLHEIQNKMYYLSNIVMYDTP